MTEYELAVLRVLAVAKGDVGWYRIERDLSRVAIAVRERLPDALERLSAQGFVERGATPDTWRVTEKGHAAPAAERAWMFATDLRDVRLVKARLEATSGTRWTILDRENELDVVSGHPIERTTLTIAVGGGLGSAHLHVEPSADVAAATCCVLDVILPVLGAREVAAIDPPRRER